MMCVATQLWTSTLFRCFPLEMIDNWWIFHRNLLYSLLQSLLSHYIPIVFAMPATLHVNPINIASCSYHISDVQHASQHFSIFFCISPYLSQLSPFSPAFLHVFPTCSVSFQAPQLVANLPVAIERGHPSGSFDPKLPLTSGTLAKSRVEWN